MALVRWEVFELIEGSCCCATAGCASVVVLTIETVDHCCTL